MKNKFASILLFQFLICLVIIMHSCKKDAEKKGTNADLYEMSIKTNGFTWYKKSDALLNKSIGSGHPQAFLRTRYNAIAAAMLDSIGKVIPGSQFPEGSLVVKELFKDANTLERYAILYKQSNNHDADSRGWVWGYINVDKSVEFDADRKGSSCTGCHTQADNIDYMLMSKFFP
jgi:hypothetical protein